MDEGLEAMTVTDPVLDLVGVQILANAGKSLEQLLADATGEQLRQLMQAAEQVSAAAEREVLRRNAAEGADHGSIAAARYIRGWSLRDIADELGCSHETVRQELLGAGVRLRTQSRRARRGGGRG